MNLEAEMKERRLERLGIADIQRAISMKGLVFLPIGPLEWHSYHLPYGTDPLNAEAHAHALAECMDGLVHPTMFMGTNLKRSPDEKDWLDIGHEKNEVIGMDFPGFPVRSMYWSADVVELAAREAVKQLIKVGFRAIVIMNGHGDDSQRSILRSVAEDLTATDVKVFYFIPFWDENGEQRWIGHAELFETAVAIHSYPDLVDLKRLPEDGKLAYNRYGIIEGRAFGGDPAEDKSCIDEADPRKASYSLGQHIFHRNVEMIAKALTEAMG
jgi:creatinine amidohydrolase